jgi:hypothetical protein
LALKSAKVADNPPLNTTQLQNPRPVMAESKTIPDAVSKRANEVVSAVFVSFSAKTIPVLLCASVALMIQAAQTCGDLNKYGGGYCGKAADGLLAYAVAVGTVSAIICVGYIFMRKFSPASLVRFDIYIAFFLAIWWSLGAGILTFDAPYTQVGNGYFATWVGCIAANVYLFLSSQAIREGQSQIRVAAEQQPAFLLMLASFVEMIAAANVCSNVNYCEDELGWAVAVGCLSIVITAVVMFCALKNKPLPRLIMQMISVTLVVIWIAGVYVNTFIAPFKAVGNGYLASWSAMFLSIMFAENVFSPTFHHSAPARASNQGAPPNEGFTASDTKGSRESVETL